MSRAESFVVVATAALSLFCLVGFSGAQVTRPSEVDALQAIRSSLVDRLDKLKNWNSGDPCTSNWTGVICFNSTLDDGYLHVQELQLLRLNLSGKLAPELGNLTYLTILDFMWNSITGSIPKEIGDIKTLKLLLLNGNQLYGPLPEELGYLPNLDRIQIDQNNISGPLPVSFQYLNKTKHFHMNNNSISGPIPPELSRLPSLVHFLLDNNNLSGPLPENFSRLPNLLILQLDNNNFSGESIPASYSNMTKLLKMSLRNCNLQGPVPDLSSIPQLGYLDLSFNQLTGSIPSGKLASNITTIDLSYNNLSGPIPSSFSGLPNLQRLSLENNSFDGSVPSDIWDGVTLTGNRTLILDFRNNNLTNSSTLNPPANVTVELSGNPVCTNGNQLQIEQFCQAQTTQLNDTSESKIACGTCPSDLDYEPNPLDPIPCFCAVPLRVEYRLKSPGFDDFVPYESMFQGYLTGGLHLARYQMRLISFYWEEGPRLRMELLLFPDNVILFNSSEVLRIRGMFTGWQIEDSDIFGPYELINFNMGSYASLFSSSKSSKLSTGAIVGIVLGAAALTAAISTLVTCLIMKKNKRKGGILGRSSKKIPIRIDGVKSFTFAEMMSATNDFSNSNLVGQGGYGKVYRGVLADRTVVAIKRAQQGSLQGSKEFFTEIELLSRLHHRNLVSLIGICDEEDEQMLVYEFMPNGSLRDHLSSRSKSRLGFSARVRIAIGSAKGILYLHTEADPPIYHRDVKASNILLDSKFVAKVADFGLSRLAPVPEAEGNAPGHVSTVVKGTPGYLDPEYFLTHKLTDKSDVYSLGVVFLELLTGMQPIYHGKNIIREVTTVYQSGNIHSIIDKRMDSYPPECVEKFVALALQCCKDETDDRPSMSEVVRELESIWRMIPDPTEAATSESNVSSNAKKMTPTSSTVTNRDAYVSNDISGSDLLSSVMHSVTPR